MALPGSFSSGRGFKRRMGATLTGRRGHLGRQGSGVPDRVGQRQEVIRAWLLRRGRHGQAQNLPAPRDSERIRVLLAKIVTMRFGVGGQRTKDRRGIRVDVRQSGYR